MTPLGLIREYYGRIDANDIDWVMRLFADDASYARADSEYSGKTKIDRFFREKRKIAGEHRIDDIYSMQNVVISRGRFSGTGASGDDRQVDFVDFWYFRDDGLVRRRETFLALGQAYIKE